MTDAAGEGPLTPTGDQALADHGAIREEHRTIRELTHGLESVRDLDELLRRLHEFRAVLRAHFVGEEAPEGFFDIIRTSASRHLGRVDRLGKDHAEFLGELDRLVERACACLAGPVAEILGEAGDLARRLRAHEAAENDLLIDALYLDLGEED